MSSTAPRDCGGDLEIVRLCDLQGRSVLAARPTRRPASSSALAVHTLLDAAWRSTALRAVGAPATVSGAVTTVITPAGTASIRAAGFQSAAGVLQLRATVGQLAVSVTGTGGAAGHVADFTVKLAASGRRTAACTSVPVQVWSFSICRVE